MIMNDKDRDDLIAMLKQRIKENTARMKVIDALIAKKDKKLNEQALKFAINKWRS